MDNCCSIQIQVEQCEYFLVLWIGELPARSQMNVSISRGEPVHPLTGKWRLCTVLICLSALTTGAQPLRVYFTPYRAFEGDAVRFVYFEQARAIAKSNLIGWPADLERLQTVLCQAAVQNLPVNADAVPQQRVLNFAQVRDQSFAMSGFQDADTAHDGQALRLGQAPRGAFVNDGQISPERTREQDGGEFAVAQRMHGAQLEQVLRGCRRMNLYPRRAADRLSRRPARASHDHFLAHFVSNVESSEEFAQQIEPASPRQRDKRGGIGDNDHSFRRAAVARSSTRSSAA